MTKMEISRMIGLLILIVCCISSGYSALNVEWSHTLPTTSSGGFNHGATINGVYYVTNAYAPHYFTGINISTGDIIDYVLVNSGSGTNGQGGFTVPVFTADYQYAWVSFGTPWNSDFVLSKIRLSDFVIVDSVTGIDGTGVEEFAYDDTYFYTVEHAGIKKRLLSDGSQIDSYSYTLTIGDGRTSGTLLVNNTLYFTKQSSILVAINSTDMTELWSLSLNGSSSYAYNTPSYDRETGYLYLGEGTVSNSGYFYAVDPETHLIVWSIQGDSCSFSSIHATCNNKIVAPCYNTGGTGYYYGLNKSTGEIYFKVAENNGWKAPVCDDTYFYNWRNAGTSDFNKRYLSNGTIAETLAVGTTSFCDSGNLVSDGEKYLYIGSGNGVRAFNLGATTERLNTWQYKGKDKYYNANYHINISQVYTPIPSVNYYYNKITINVDTNVVDMVFVDIENSLICNVSNSRNINWLNLVWGNI